MMVRESSSPARTRVLWLALCLGGLAGASSGWVQGPTQRRVHRRQAGQTVPVGRYLDLGASLNSAQRDKGYTPTGAFWDRREAQDEWSESLDPEHRYLDLGRALRLLE